MILLDPDLDPDPAQRASATKISPASVPDKNKKIPTARTLARFLALAQKTVRLRGEVNVQLTTDAAIRKLNRQFRGIDKPTDVLAFPAEPDAGKQLAGEIAISAEIASHNAHALGHSPAEEVKILVLHGVLHLRGYDHQCDNGQMARREKHMRAKLHLPLGLIERTTIGRTTPERARTERARRKR